jgi:hypothetical protein
MLSVHLRLGLPSGLLMFSITVTELRLEAVCPEQFAQASNINVGYRGMDCGLWTKLMNPWVK